MDYRYTYDAAGNITQRQTEEGTYQYAYDLIDRLTHATPPQHLQQNPITPEADKLPVEAYSYDPVHNRLSSQHQPGLWQYNQDNQLQSYGVGIERRSYTYTPNGHTATETTGDPAIKTREFIYNAAERLIEIKDNNQTIGQYQYDPMGRRIKKHTPEGTTWFLYSDEGLIAEVDPTGNPTRYYGWKPNGLWGTDPLWLADKATTAPNTWQPHLYHNDHLWTPQRLTNTQGEVQWSARSEAFGRTAAIINTTRNPLRFPGQYEDEQGLHYNWNRDYNPGLGRYVQSDPIGLKGGVNNYAYSEVNSLIYFDEAGLRAQVCCVKIPKLPAVHCFINLEYKEEEGGQCCSPQPVSKARLGLHGPPPGGDSDYRNAGQIKTNHGFDDVGAATCGPWRESCDAIPCVLRNISAYPDPSKYRLLGPNSNTFAAAIANSCGLQKPSTKWRAVGWESEPTTSHPNPKRRKGR